MVPLILFRNIGFDIKEEVSIAQKYFKVETQRTKANNNLVIGRYSVLPYYLEIEKDLDFLSSKLINSYSQHNYIANFDWYYDISDYTFKSYTDYDFYLAPEGKYVVKGRTNSKKFNWSTKMFANSKREASNIACELANDSMIGSQGIIYREYEELEKVGENLINDLPMANEWRIFFYKEDILCHGHYWAHEHRKIDVKINDGLDFAKEVAKIISENVNFFVIDIGRTIDKRWKVIEINDGQMSGLSECNPEELYSNLFEKVKNG